MEHMQQKSGNTGSISENQNQMNAQMGNTESTKGNYGGYPQSMGNTATSGNIGYQPNTGNAGNAAYQPNAGNTGNAAYKPNARNAGNTAYQPNAGNARNTAYQPNAGNAGNTAYQPNAGYAGNAAYTGTNGYQTNYSSAAGRTTGGNTGNLSDAGRAVNGNMANSAKQPKKGKRFLLNCVSGLLFGIFAAMAFFAVYEIRDAIILRTGESTQNVSLDGGEQNNGNDTDMSPAGNGESEDTTTVMANGNVEIQTTEPILHTSENTSIIATDVSDVVEQVMPSIVTVTNNYTESNYYYVTESESSGSGIIIATNENELLIVTNYHVIANNDRLRVTFVDDSVVEAQIKGTDSDMDLAVIAVPLDNLSENTIQSIRVATIGDSDNLRVGETAIAIGNALGYGQSVTTGVISAVDRELDIDGETGSFIQTDAAINYGNSGGALLNIRGEVIGINSNKIGGSAVEGMGYAIPISAAKPILEELMTKETRTIVAEEDQGYLGISGANITMQEQQYYGYPDGIYVANVYDGTAADEAGICKGDFLASFDGEEISSMEGLQHLLQYYEAGSTVKVIVYRDTIHGYEELELEVTLGRRF